MKYAFPEAIFPGDIGCYTLGTAQGAVDTFLDMGSGVTFAEGFYDAFNQDGNLCRSLPLLAIPHSSMPVFLPYMMRQKKRKNLFLSLWTTAQQL